MFSKKLLTGLKKSAAVFLAACMMIGMFTCLTLVTALTVYADEPVETETAVFIGRTGSEKQAAIFIPVDIKHPNEDANLFSGEETFMVSFKCKMLSGSKPVVGVLRTRKDGDPNNSGSANATFSEPDWCDQDAIKVEDGICTATIRVDFANRINPNGEGSRSFYLVIGNSLWSGGRYEHPEEGYTAYGDFEDSFILSDVKLVWYDAEEEAYEVDEDTGEYVNRLPAFTESNINFKGTYFFRHDECEQWDSPLGATAMQWHVLSAPAYVKQVKVPADYNTAESYNAANFTKVAETNYTREYYTNENYPDTYFAALKYGNDAGFEIISNDVGKKMVVIEANHEGEEDVIADETIPQLNKAGNIFLPISLGQYTLQGGATTDKNVILKVTFKADRLEGDAAPVLGRIVGKKSGTSGRGSQGWGLSTNNVRNAAYYKNYKRSDNGGGVRPQCTYDPETGEFVGWVGMSTSNNGNATRWGTNEVLTIGNAEHVYEEGKFDSTSFNSSFAISDIKVDLYDVSVSDNVHTVTDLIAEDIVPQLYAETVDDTSNWAYQYTGSASNHDHDPIRASQYKWSVDGCTGMVHAEDLTSCIKENHKLTYHAAEANTCEYWECSCGKTFADSFAKTEITDTSAAKQAIKIAASEHPASAFTTVKLAGFNGCQWYRFTCKVKRTGEKDPEVSTLYAKYNGTNVCEATAGGDNAVIESSYDPETGVLTGYIMGWLPPDPGKTDHYNMKTRYPYLRYNPISGANIAILIGNGHYVGDGGYAGDSVDTEITIGEPELYKVNCTTYDASAVDEAKAAENIGDNLIAPITDKTVKFENEYVATWNNGNNPLAAPMGKWYSVGKDKENVTAKNIPDNYFSPDYVECDHAVTHTVEAVASTCHTQGHGEYVVCDNCGEIMSGSATALPTDPNNHDGGESELYYNGAAQHWHICLGCGEPLNPEDHTFVWVLTKAATETEDGLEEETCSVCGYKTGETRPVEYVAYIAGDINNDGDVNNKDLTRLFQYLSEWDVVVNEAALDVNGDGDVNNKDLTRLFQYLSEWDVVIH